MIVTVTYTTSNLKWKIMKRTVAIYILAFLMLAGAVPALSQDNPNPEQTQARITQEFIQSRMYQAIKGYNSDTNVEGSPYYNENWQQGYFIKHNGRITANYSMRFNIFKNQLEFKLDENTHYIASKKPISGFVLRSDDEPEVTFTKGFEVPGSDINSNTFLQVLYDGKTKLLVYYSTKFYKGHTKDMFTGKKTDKYVTKTDYYLANSDGSIDRVKLKEKDILKNLGGLTDKLKSFIERNDLNLKNEEDVVSLLAEYDRLMAQTPK